MSVIAASQTIGEANLGRGDTKSRISTAVLTAHRDDIPSTQHTRTCVDFDRTPPAGTTEQVCAAERGYTLTASPCSPDTGAVRAGTDPSKVASRGAGSSITTLKGRTTLDNSGMIDRSDGQCQEGIGRCPEILSSTPTVTRARKLKTGSIELTVRQNDALQAIRGFVTTYKVAPARSELRSALGLSKHSSVEKLLHGLERKKWISMHPGVERGIVLLREGIPLYEARALRASASGTHLRGARPEEPTWIDCEALWDALRTKPDLLIAGVREGAILALSRRRDEDGRLAVCEGDTIAVRIDSDIALRHVRTVDRNALELRPESRSQRTVRVDRWADDADIIGVVVGQVLAAAG